MTFLFRAFSDSVDWAYTPEVNAQIQESKSPHLYDAYAREPYTDKALPKEFRLPLLMVKSYVMRNKLNKHYTDFVMKHPKFLKDARSNRKNTMPMCTVMQDDEYLTWGSSARMNISLKPKAEVTDEDRRFIEGLTKNLNERQGKRDAHTTRWACGEQGCQNAIAREEAQKSKAAGTERTLSVMSYGTFMGDPATSTLEEPTIKTPSEIETISNQEKDLATKKFLEQQEPRDREETMNPSKSEDQEESLDLEPSLNPDEPPSPPGSSSSKESSKSEKSLNSGSGSDSETSFVFDRTSDSEEAPNSKASPDLTWIETDSKFNEGCDPTQRNEHDKTNDMEDEEQGTQ
ncbi:hypothetical protein MMC34_004708 [Xylographa carneopallida]|nr:hypothetical protein [Xylographa carneopallida]